MTKAKKNEKRGKIWETEGKRERERERERRERERERERERKKRDRQTKNYIKQKKRQYAGEKHIQ